MITPIQVTLPVPSIPMPAWAHQWLMFIIGIATVVSTSASVWGPGFGMSLHIITLTAGVALSVATLFRAIDAASETIVKNATLETMPNGKIAVLSTTNRKKILTNANLPEARPSDSPDITYGTAAPVGG